MNHFVVHLKLTQHCRSTILQYKIKIALEGNEFWRAEDFDIIKTAACVSCWTPSGGSILKAYLALCSLSQTGWSLSSYNKTHGLRKAIWFRSRIHSSWSRAPHVWWRMSGQGKATLWDLNSGLRIHSRHSPCAKPALSTFPLGLGPLLSSPDRDPRGHIVLPSAAGGAGGQVRGDNDEKPRILSWILPLACWSPVSIL